MFNEITRVLYIAILMIIIKYKQNTYRLNIITFMTKTKKAVTLN